MGHLGCAMSVFLQNISDVIYPSSLHLGFCLEAWETDAVKCPTVTISDAVSLILVQEVNLFNSSLLSSFSPKLCFSADAQWEHNCYEKSRVH